MFWKLKYVMSDMSNSTVWYSAKQDVLCMLSIDSFFPSFCAMRYEHC